MTVRKTLCQVSDIPDGGAIAVEAGDAANPASIILLRQGQRVLAYNNECPHTGRRLDWMKNYLISLRGIDAQRIKTVDGGETSCLTYQFWLVPPGTAPVPRNDAWSRAFDNLEVARKFDEYRWDAPHAIPDSFSVDYAGGLEGFADALRKEPRSFGYLIAYSEYRFDLVGEPERLVRRATIDPPGTALKYLNQLKRILVKNLKVSPAKVRLVDGGYRDSRAIEFWIVPRGAYAPVPTPNMLPKRRRVQ